MSIGLDLTELSRLGESLSQLKPSTRSRILADAAGLASRPIAQKAKELAPVESGALRRAIGHVVRRYPEKGKVVAIIGARKGYYKDGKKVKDPKPGQGNASPAKYSHLVEFGTRRSKPKPFLRPAVETRRAEADRILGEGFARAVEAEHKRVLRKNK